MSELVSVIIPCKNAALWLGDAIESCLNQTWPNIEIIVVDNGSTDESMAVARRYHDMSIKIFECKRIGASAARNVGLKYARGALLQFLDADDVLDRDKIRAQAERLEQLPKGIIASGAWSSFRHAPAEAVFFPEQVWRDCKPEEFLIWSWLGGGMMPPLVWLTPRPLIEIAGPWNEELSVNDDGEFFSRVILASAGIAFCEGAQGFYRKTPDITLSKRRDTEALTSLFKAAELSCKHLLEHCSSESALSACACHFQSVIYNLYPHLPELVEIAERRVFELGGSELKIGGGEIFKFISTCFGWKFARRCQLYWQAIRRPSLENAGI